MYGAIGFYYMRKYKDYTNKRVGRLTVLKISHRYNRQIQWLCKCDCGKITIVSSGNFKNNHTRSCGCFSKDNPHRIAHGMTGTRFHNIYRGIRTRCGNNKAYIPKRYSSIKCLWVSFDEFKKDMYAAYLLHIKKHGEKNTSIDRIDNNGNYSKENCRWATMKIQSLNKSTAIMITYMGETKNSSEWAKIVNLSGSLIRERINSGWSAEDALTIRPKLGQKIYKHDNNAKLLTLAKNQAI